MTRRPIHSSAPGPAATPVTVRVPDDLFVARYETVAMDRVGALRRALYPLLVACGVAILYSLVIMLAAATILMGRNQSLYDFFD